MHEMGFNREKGIVSTELRLVLERAHLPWLLFGNGSLLLGPTNRPSTITLDLSEQEVETSL